MHAHTIHSPPCERCLVAEEVHLHGALDAVADLYRALIGRREYSGKFHSQVQDVLSTLRLEMEQLMAEKRERLGTNESTPVSAKPADLF